MINNILKYNYRKIGSQIPKIDQISKKFLITK